MDISSVAAFVVGLTFVTSGLAKLRDANGFVVGVLEYDILPARLAIIYGRLLPALEFICGVALIAGFWSLAVGIVSIVVMLSFVAAVSTNMVRRRQLDCHCFGANGNEPIGWTTLVRLGILLACAVVVAVGGHARPALLPVRDLLPQLLSGVGIVLALYLLPAAPWVWRVWRTKPIVGVTPHGGRVSFKSYPLRGSILGVSHDGVISTDVR